MRTPSAPPGRPTSASSAATTSATRGRRRCARSTSPPRSRAVRGGRHRALARHPGGRPDGRRADDLPEGVVRRVPGRPGRDAAPQRGTALKTPQEIERMRLANEIAAAAMEHVQGVIRPGHDRGAGRLRVARLRPRRGHGLGRARSSSRSASRSSGRAPGSGPSRRPPTGPSSRASRRCSRSGSAPTATGATTRRTSSPAS